MKGRRRRVWSERRRRTQRAGTEMSSGEVGIECDERCNSILLEVMTGT